MVHELELSPLDMRQQREDLSLSLTPTCCPHKPDNYAATAPPALHGHMDQQPMWLFLQVPIS